ncbi:hypothetical protein ACWC9Q_10540 [Streptomyces sp. NPDC001142]
MTTDPDIVFAADPRYGLVARSGWEQEEARTVLRDLGWEWEEELHILVPPDDVPERDAGVQAVEELHLHGFRTGYAVGPYGAMRLTSDRAEQVFAKLTVRDAAGAGPDSPSPDVHQMRVRQGSPYNRTTIWVEPTPVSPEWPPI